MKFSVKSKEGLPASVHEGAKIAQMASDSACGVKTSTIDSHVLGDRRGGGPQRSCQTVTPLNVPTLREVILRVAAVCCGVERFTFDIGRFTLQTFLLFDTITSISIN